MRARKCQELLPEAKVNRDKFNGIQDDKRYINYYNECQRKGTPIPNGPAPKGAAKTGGGGSKPPAKVSKTKTNPTPKKEPEGEGWFTRAWNWTKKKAGQAKDWVVDKIYGKKEEKKAAAPAKKVLPSKKAPAKKAAAKAEAKPAGRGEVTRATNLMRARKCQELLPEW